jgi:hypothetical protein
VVSAWENPYTKANKPAVAVRTPGMSRRGRLVERSAVSKRAAAVIATAPMSRLTNSVERHEE